MKKEDYLLRIIEEMGQRIGHMIAQAMQLQQADKHGSAHELIEQSVMDLIDLPLSRLLHIDVEALLSQLQNEPLWQERAHYLALLLKQDADIYESEGEDTAVYHRTNLALHLWLALDHQADEPLIDFDTIDKTYNELSQFQLRGVMYAKMMSYYKAQAQFGLAENVLFDWLESDVALEDINQFNPLEIGVEFYQSLEQLDDTLLENGGLPRQEVRIGKKELMSHFNEE